ncbi:MAG: succinyldiaminopimelate transaminase [Nitriliruptoraceae bacterium]|nr:succinyldiaminopimelate transaminase [Nitriliruptoraceae bacterium]
MVTSNPILDAMGGNPLAGMQDLANERRAGDGPVFDFAVGDPDEPTPEPIRRALLDAVGPVSRYPTAAGQPALRGAVADWFARRHGVTLDPATQVVPSAGSKEAVFHLPLALVDPTGDRRHVLWGDPGYPIYGRGAQLAGGISDPVTLTHDGGWRLDLTAIETDRLARACMVWVNHPHNPTGATADLGYYREQLAVCREHDLLLASDECYQEVWFDRPPPSALEATDGDHAGVLAFVSLSKRSGMTGYRSGAIAGDAALIARLKRLRPYVGTASPDFVQAAAIAAWRDQDHVDERRAVFAAKRDIVLGFLTRAGIEVSGSQATFYVWFRAPGGDDEAYARALLDVGIIASPGRAFGPGGHGWLRLALVPTEEGCRAAVAAWQAAIDADLLPR